VKLELAHAALDDLRSIRAYTLERWGPDQEQQYLDQIWKKFESILTDPSKFRFRRDLFPGCQIAAEGKLIEEIPKLTHLERRELFLQVLSLEPDADDVAVCDHVAREGFALLDEMEAADSTHG